MTAKQTLSDADWQSKTYEIIELFSPGAPIDENDLFAGRQHEISQIIEAALQRGQHAIVYGERGVGKTSLAKTFSLRLIRPTKTLSSVIVNCDPQDTFTSLWRKVYKDLGEEGGGNVLDGTTINDISPDDVRRVLTRFDLTTTPIIILDEFDKLQDPNAKALIANTIKSLSDYSVAATIVLVGVAKSVNDLLRDHASIGRALIQIPMPRMKAAELAEIIDKRLPRVGMTITPAAKAQIVALSAGLPHYTHLLGQHAGRRAIESRSLTIDVQHVDDAERDCLERAHHSIREQYHRATQSPRSGNIYKEVLLACALAEPDELGFFPAKAIEVPLSIIMQKQYKVAMFGQHLKILCEADRAKMLEVTGSPRRFRYRFEEPLMQPYVILRGLADGLITKNTLRQLMPNYLQPRLSGGEV
ncbi:MAG TPA: AAA family ATPase [Burkholderiales bacterium]|nr:AAA family ATPase [Burkholderiales bacterium]